MCDDVDDSGYGDDEDGDENNNDDDDDDTSVIVPSCSLLDLVCGNFLSFKQNKKRK